MCNNHPISTQKGEKRMYNMKIEFSKKELNEIMEEMEQAQEKIFECWKRLESLGVAVVRESGHSDEQPDRN